MNMGLFDLSDKEKQIMLEGAKQKLNASIEKFTSTANTMFTWASQGVNYYNKNTEGDKLKVNYNTGSKDSFITIQFTKGAVIMKIQVNRRNNSIVLNYQKSGKNSETLSFDELEAAKNKAYAFIATFKN